MQLFNLFDTHKIRRKESVFQMPKNPFSSCRYSVHSSGSGSGWNETLGVDEPHGLDFQEWNDIRIGIRLRAGQEHTAPADNTAGFIHTPGGCAILAMDITNAAGDPTGNVVADGTYRGHGLAWTYVVQAGANKGLLWCATAAAGASTTGDWTLVKLHPDLQWAGGDVTWAGGHQFDASLSVVNDVSVGGNLGVGGDFSVDSTSDFGGAVAMGGDLSIAGTLKVATDITITGDMAVDGTSNLTGHVACGADFSVDGTAVFQDTVVTGDSTFTFDPIAGETGPIFKILGDWSTRANNTTYTARTDGIALGIKTGGGDAILKIATPSGTLRQHANTQGQTSKAVSVLTPVKAGATWDVSSGDVVYWLPIGDNT